MAITLQSDRQESAWATVDFSYTDLTSGSAATAIKLPVGAVVVGGAVVVKTAFNSGTSDALVVGDSATANRYLASTSVAAAGRTALVPTGYQALPTTREIKVTWTAVGTAASAGAIRLEINYLVPGRATFSQD